MGVVRTIWAARYGLPALICLVALVFFAVDPGENFEGAAALMGAGLSVLLLNVLHRIGVRGDEDRVREDDARRYFDRHGRWPDDPA